MKSDSICILMATFNGENYIREQILSLQNQSLNNWRLLVRDDNSMDSTLEILNEIAASDIRIEIVENNGKKTVGALNNFGYLMEAGIETNSDVFFLCDQDDVWASDKLELILREFPENGEEQNSLLVFSDLCVVNEKLEKIDSSYMHYMSIKAEFERPLNYLVTRNFVTGCSCAFNRKLLIDALPIPASGIIMHDWWIASVAAAAGQIIYLPISLVKYRQHESNTIGASGFWVGLMSFSDWKQRWHSGSREFELTFRQAEEIYKHGNKKGTWPVSSLMMVSEYTGIPKMTLINRLRTALKLGLRKGHFILRIVYFIRLLYMPNTMK